MDSVDRLLAELKAKHTQPSPSATKATDSPSPPELSASLLPTDSLPTDSLDQLLDQLDEQDKQAVRSHLTHHRPTLDPHPTPTVVSNLFAVEGDRPFSLKQRSPEDQLLSHVQRQYAEQDRLQTLQQEQERLEAERQYQQAERDKQRRLEALQQQRRANLAHQAEAWLKQLKPRSEEGLWFEEFACNYESRLEAAIEYLEALESVKRESRL